MQPKLAAGETPDAAPATCWRRGPGSEVPLPALGDGLRRLGTELVPWDGGTAVVVLYRSGDGRAGQPVRRRGRQLRRRGARRRHTVRGRTTVFWQTGPFAYALTGGLPEPELLAIARARGATAVAGLRSDLVQPRELPMAEPLLDPYTTARWASQAEFDEGLRRHMLQVYNYMMLGLALTGIVAYVVGTTPGAVRADLRHAPEVGGDAGAAGVRVLLLVPASRPCRPARRS